VRRFPFLGAIQSIGVVVAFFWKVHSAGLPFAAFTVEHPVYREAITLTQAGIVVSQFFNGFTVRTERESVFRIGLLSNPRLVVAEFLGVAIMAAMPPSGRSTTRSSSGDSEVTKVPLNEGRLPLIFTGKGL
jgi:P-type Ca2+ transporter type 2C